MGEASPCNEDAVVSWGRWWFLAQGLAEALGLDQCLSGFRGGPVATLPVCVLSTHTLLHLLEWGGVPQERAVKVKCFLRGCDNVLQEACYRNIGQGSKLAPKPSKLDWLCRAFVSQAAPVRVEPGVPLTRRAPSQDDCVEAAFGEKVAEVMTA